MLFNSYIFVFLFLPVTLAGWYFLNRIKWHKAAYAFLIGMSLWFYGYFNANYLLLILISIIGNYLISMGLTFFEKSSKSEPIMDKASANKNNIANDSQLKYARKIAIVLGLLLNLGILFYFKYYDFFIENINNVFKLGLTTKNILLPLGISFFTFQQMSFIIERGWGWSEHYTLLEYAAFVTFFPQLIAGPIVLHSELIPELSKASKSGLSLDNMYDGVVSFVFGLAKKVLLADTLALVANYGFDHAPYLDTFSVITVMVAYALELYFDFSGYSDMAIGLAAMFGIKLPVNFNSPYKSSSLKALWGRWHITLTRFMTTYVYIPLGGNRKGRVRTLINVFIVFVLSGLWHGAAWTYVVWGALTGLIVVWDNLGIIGFDAKEKHPARIILPKWLGVIFTNFAFTMLLIPFRSPNLTTAWQICKDFFVGWTGNLYKLAGSTMDIPEIYLIKQVMTRIAPDKMTITYVIVMFLIIAIGIVVVTRRNVREILSLYRGKSWLNAVVVMLFVYSVISFSQVSTFIYFNF